MTASTKPEVEHVDAQPPGRLHDVWAGEPWGGETLCDRRPVRQPSLCRLLAIERWSNWQTARVNRNKVDATRPAKPQPPDRRGKRVARAIGRKQLTKLRRGLQLDRARL